MRCLHTVSHSCDACQNMPLSTYCSDNNIKQSPHSSCVEMPSYEDYTLAVICARDFEMTTVRFMLDEEQDELPNKEGDSNSYILGVLNGHRIALAWLPGTQGKGAAAVVATNLLRTFQSIRWRFLVGIGGGVPHGEKHDICLGGRGHRHARRTLRGRRAVRSR